MLGVPIPVKLFAFFLSCFFSFFFHVFLNRSTGFSLGSLKETASSGSESIDPDEDPIFSYGDSDNEM